MDRRARRASSPALEHQASSPRSFLKLSPQRRSRSRAGSNDSGTTKPAPVILAPRKRSRINALKRDIRLINRELADVRARLSVWENHDEVCPLLQAGTADTASRSSGSGAPRARTRSESDPDEGRPSPSSSLSYSGRSSPTVARRASSPNSPSQSSLSTSVPNNALRGNSPSHLSMSGRKLNHSGGRSSMLGAVPEDSEMAGFDTVTSPLSYSQERVQIDVEDVEEAADDGGASGGSARSYAKSRNRLRRRAQSRSQEIPNPSRSNRRLSIS